MSIDHQVSDSASPDGLPTQASVVEAGREPFSVLAVNTDVRANQNDERRIEAPNHLAYASPLVELLEQRAGDSSISAVGHRKKWIGSFAAALGGLDTPVFGARRIKLRGQAPPVGLYPMAYGCGVLQS